MAEIVLGLACSHGPMLSTPPEGWDLRVPDDRRTIHHFRGRTWTFDQLVEERRGENFTARFGPDIWRQQHAKCRASLTQLANVFEEVKPDVAVLVGDDQMECFRDTLVPAFGIYYGETFRNSELAAEQIAKLPPGIGISIPGHIPPGGATYPGCPSLGLHVIDKLMDDGFDVAALKHMPHDHTPHAHGFLCRQVMLDKVIPSVPVFVNTYYPPNQPKAARCAALGTALRKAIQSWPDNLRVAILASGGLTHFVINEEIDQIFLEGMRTGNLSKINALGEPIFQSGTSEVKNWLPVMQAMSELKFKATIVDYIPCYRSPAGTGCSMAFAYWRP
jgi:hypothetical protein